MGSRGASSGGGGAGGMNPADIVSTESLISARGENQSGVDDTLTVARDIYDKYGITVTDFRVATLKGKSAKSVMGYYDGFDNLAINKAYFDSKKMDSAYDSCVKSGWHPPRGNKTGTEALVAHEMGHKLSDAMGKKLGYNINAVEGASSRIILEAKKNLGVKSVGDVRKKVSGYAKKNNAEAVAEAFADVYCNGKKASKESRAIVDVLDKYMRR